MVEPGELLKRELEPTGKTLLGGTRMKVLQWNVLADGLSGNCEGSARLRSCCALALYCVLELEAAR